jgi:hypothetical protein
MLLAPLLARVSERLGIRRWPNSCNPVLSSTRWTGPSCRVTRDRRPVAVEASPPSISLHQRFTDEQTQMIVDCLSRVALALKRDSDCEPRSR